MVACSDSTTDATTYNPAAWQALSTGRADSDAVSVWVGVIGEDSATAFTVSSVSIEGVNGISIVDQGAVGSLVDAALFRGNNTGVNSTSFITGAAQVNISVTFSEAITGAAICVYTMKSSDISGAGPGTAAASSFDTASASITLSNTGPPLVGKGILGICGSETNADSTTWTGLTEQVDTSNAELSYSAATAVVPDGTPPQTFVVTCDYAGSGDAVGAQAGTGP